MVVNVTYVNLIMMMMVKLKTLPMNNTRIKLAMDDRRIRMMDHSWERLCRRGLHCLRHIFESNECTYTSWQPNIMRIQAEQQLKATRPVTNNVYICIFIGKKKRGASLKKPSSKPINTSQIRVTHSNNKLYYMVTYGNVTRSIKSLYMWICACNVRWVQFERAQVFAIRFASAEVSIAIHHIYMQTYIYTHFHVAFRIGLRFVRNKSESLPHTYSERSCWNCHQHTKETDLRTSTLYLLIHFPITISFNTKATYIYTYSKTYFGHNHAINFVIVIHCRSFKLFNFIFFTLGHLVYTLFKRRGSEYGRIQKQKPFGGFARLMAVNLTAADLGVRQGDKKGGSRFWCVKFFFVFTYLWTF